MWVLVDTSVWRRYFAGVSRFEPLAELLDGAEVLTHPFVVGELVMGGLSRRQEELFEWLPFAPSVPHEDVRLFVRKRRLTRRGIGWVDAHLLASSLASSARLWTDDKSLAKAAERLGTRFEP